MSEIHCADVKGAPIWQRRKSLFAMRFSHTDIDEFMAVSPMLRHPTCTQKACSPSSSQGDNVIIASEWGPVQFTVLFTPKDAAEDSWPNFRSGNEATFRVMNAATESCHARKWIPGSITRNASPFSFRSGDFGTRIFPRRSFCCRPCQVYLWPSRIRIVGIAINIATIIIANTQTPQTLWHEIYENKPLATYTKTSRAVS